MTQHPLYALILSVVIIFVLIECSIQQGKLYTLRLTLSFFNTFIIGLLWILSTNIETDFYNQVFNIVMIVEYGLFGIVIFVMTHTYLQKMKSHNMFVDSFKNTTFSVYFVLNKKDKIKEISESLLVEMGYKREDVIGKKFFDIANQRIRFFRLDDTNTNNEMLKDFYKTYPKTATPSEEVKREIYFYNTNGQTVILNLLEKPIFFKGKYKGRMNVGQKQDNNMLLSTEKELKHQNDALESVQHKFIATLELTHDGIFFYEINENYVWCNDNLVKTLGLRQNTLSITDYHAFIHPDDFGVYTSVINNLSKDNPTYKISYRFKTGYNYEYVTETGKRIFEDKTNPTILAFVGKQDNSYFAKSSYKHLDEIKSYDELIADTHSLLNNNMNFDLVMLRTTNLSDINVQQSRKIGDMVLAEYIKQVKTLFLSESSDIYRVTGTDFVFTITDNNKMALLRKCLESSNEVMNYKKQYGSTSVVLEINMGIAQSYKDGNDSTTLVKNVKKAMMTSLNKKYTTNYAFYKDIAND